MDSMSSRVKTVDLGLRKIGITAGISGEMLEQLKLTGELDLIRDQMMYTLQSKVWAEDLPPEQVTDTDTFTVEVPATWWQHAKQRYAEAWWMGWLARRRPPRLRTINIEGTFTVNLRRFRVYPDAPPIASRYGRHVAMYETDQDVRWITSEGGVFGAEECG